MAWTSGTAAGFKDLLVNVHNFCVAQGWKVERWAQDPDGDDELILSSTGESDQEYYTIGIKTIHNTVNDWFNFMLRSGVQYSAGAAFEVQPSSSSIQYLYLWQGDIDYHLIVNRSRLIIIAQVSGTTHTCYLGKLQSYCSLGHWPRQVGCFGEGVISEGRWSSQGNDYSNFQWFRNNARQILWTDGTFLTPSRSWPNMAATVLVSQGQVYEDGASWSLPITVIHDTHGAVGEFIDCYYIDGHNISTGQVITTADTPPRTLLVAQNIYRNGFRDFMAIELA